MVADYYQVSMWCKKKENLNSEKRVGIRYSKDQGSDLLSHTISFGREKTPDISKDPQRISQKAKFLNDYGFCSAFDMKISKYTASLWSMTKQCQPFRIFITCIKRSIRAFEPRRARRSFCTGARNAHPYKVISPVSGAVLNKELICVPPIVQNKLKIL